MGDNGTAGRTAENLARSSGAAPSDEKPQGGALLTPEVRRLMPKEVPSPNVTAHNIDEFVIVESLEPFANSYMRNVLDDDLTAFPPDFDFTALHSSDKCPNQEQAETVSAAATEATLIRASIENLASVLPVLPTLLAPDAPMNRSESSTPVSLPNLNQPSGSRAADHPTASPSFPAQAQAAMSQVPPLLRIKPPSNWTVDEVAQVIEKVPGCAKYAGQFRDQLIDGEAMFLLKVNHLIEAMDIKLGPAVKILAVIKSLRETLW